MTSLMRKRSPSAAASASSVAFASATVADAGKMKGVATIRLADGRVRRAELHWYEAHGIGRKEVKRKRYVPEG